jgi:hypothetical protein
MHNRALPSAMLRKTGSTVLWRPPKSGVPMEDYRFADRAEHEAAFAWAAQFGPQRGMPAADILPPLPHPLDALFAHAAIMPSDQWHEIPLGKVDPRTPWRTDSVNGLVRSVGHRIYLLVQPYCGGLGVAGACEGWKATLLVAAADTEVHVNEHTLVHVRSRRPVQFGDRREAERELEPLIHADGGPPGHWTWDPPIDGTAVGWTALPLDPSLPYHMQITRRGKEGRWLIVISGGFVGVWRDREAVQSANGGVRQFPDIGSAKSYCSREDG